MLTANTRKVTALICELIQSVPEEFLDKLVIFGSAAVTLHRIDLGRAVDDLDIFVARDTFSQLQKYPDFAKHSKADIDYLTIANKPNIELWPTFPGVVFEEVRQRAAYANTLACLPVASMQDLCLWKKTQARDKDLQDLKLMKAVQ